MRTTQAHCCLPVCRTSIKSFTSDESLNRISDCSEDCLGSMFVFSSHLQANKTPEFRSENTVFPIYHSIESNYLLSTVYFSPKSELTEERNFVWDGAIGEHSFGIRCGF